MPADLTPNQLKWVEALESGEFKQDGARQGNLTVRYVNGNKEHCCLGVACVLAKRDGVDVSAAIGPRAPDSGNEVVYDGETNYLPRIVQDWLGVERADPVIGIRTASMLNDGELYPPANRPPMSFAEIAAEIREHGVR